MNDDYVTTAVHALDDVLAPDEEAQWQVIRGPVCGVMALLLAVTPTTRYLVLVPDVSQPIAEIYEEIYRVRVTS